MAPVTHAYNIITPLVQRKKKSITIRWTAASHPLTPHATGSLHLTYIPENPQLPAVEKNPIPRFRHRFPMRFPFCPLSGDNAFHHVVLSQRPDLFSSLVRFYSQCLYPPPNRAADREHVPFSFRDRSKPSSSLPNPWWD